MNEELIAETTALDPDEARMVTGKLLDEHPEITAIYILRLNVLMRISRKKVFSLDIGLKTAVWIIISP